MENVIYCDHHKPLNDLESQLQEALYHINQLKSDLFYQIASKHGEEQAFNYRSINEATVFLKHIKLTKGA